MMMRGSCSFEILYLDFGKALLVLLPVTIAILCGGVVWCIFYTPSDAVQGDTYRILFVHMPAAHVALVGYIAMAFAGVTAYLGNARLAEVIVRSCAWPGAGLTIVAILSGSLWAKPTWGTWWEWDARTISTVVLLFFYTVVIWVDSSTPRSRHRSKVCALVAIIGVVNIPIVYLSVEWWFTLHQPATIDLISGNTISDMMLQPLRLMVVAFYLFFICSVLVCARLNMVIEQMS